MPLRLARLTAFTLAVAALALLSAADSGTGGAGGRAWAQTAAQAPASPATSSSTAQPPASDAAAKPDGQVQPSAQTKPEAQPAPAPAAPNIDATAKAAREVFDNAKAHFADTEAALARADLSDRQLADLRADIGPVADKLRATLDKLAPQTAAAKARLDQLGPKPDANAPPESADAVREREHRQKDYAELNDAMRVGGVLLVQADQLNARITDRRRAAFAGALFARASSILSPALWLSVAQALPGDVDALTTVGSDWIASVGGRVSDGRILPLVLAIGAAFLTYLIGRRLAPRITARDERITEPTRLRRALAATWRTIFATVPAALSAQFIIMGLDGASLLPPRVEPIATALLLGAVFITFIRALSEAMLAPDAGNWRVIQMRNATADNLNRLIIVLSALVVTGKVIEVILQTLGAPLASTIVVKAIVSLLFALTLAATLWRIHASTDCEEESLGPYVPTAPTVQGPTRIIIWAAIAAIFIGDLSGFVAFAAFIQDQVVWLAILGAVLHLCLIIVDESIGRTLTNDDSRVALALQASLGLRKKSLDQIAVIVAGVLRLLLIVVALLLVLAPWGIESTDYFGSFRAALFGLKLGGVTISVSTVVSTAVIFGVAITTTRALQRWFEVKYLPVTDLSPGLRNSITTAIGYLGIFISVALALGNLGLSLDRIAIVAGALSVGIGFGLQSIVNNFVSGLILLWERSISVGDWIVVGSEQGYVRRISVRATEIETFERAAVIVPNSNLVSGVVKNWLHNNNTGRIAIPVSVPFQPDPRVVSELLLACATAHDDIYEHPAPSVLLTSFTPTALNFELRCFADVESSTRIKSELNYTLFARLTEAGIYLAPGVPLSEVKVRLADDLEALLARAADRREDTTAPAKGAARPDPIAGSAKDEQQPAGAGPRPQEQATEERKTGNQETKEPERPPFPAASATRDT